MKKYIKILLPFIFPTLLFSQNSEFDKNPNGLIYSEKAMTKLRQIVDSLEMKFQQSYLDKAFYAQDQTIADIITFDTHYYEQIQKDIEAGISLTKLLEKNPQIMVERGKLVTKFKFKTNKMDEYLRFQYFNPEDGYSLFIQSKDIEAYDKPLKGKWLLREYKYNQGLAFYFPNEFESLKLSKRYSRMIQYADCLIDTTTTELKETRKSG